MTLKKEVMKQLNIPDPYEHDLIVGTTGAGQDWCMETTKLGAARVPDGVSATDPDIVEKLKGAEVKELTRAYIFQKEYETESIVT